MTLSVSPFEFAQHIPAVHEYLDITKFEITLPRSEEGGQHSPPEKVKF